MNKILAAFPISEKGLAFVRIVLGLLVIYHGLEVFDGDVMKMYTTWDAFKGANGGWLVYVGKSSELLSGVLLATGFLTRIGALLLCGTLAYVTFFVGHGKFWYEDQHPFMFVLFGVLFFFTGGGVWSVDAALFGDEVKG